VTFLWQEVLIKVVFQGLRALMPVRALDRQRTRGPQRTPGHCGSY